MIVKIRTFYGRSRGLRGERETKVDQGVAWLCQKCGEVILFEHLISKHFCKKLITLQVHSDK
jgi:hypothetical protein